MNSRRECLLALGALLLTACDPPAKAADPALAAWNRAAFGPRPGDLDGFRLEDFLEGQLHPLELDDSECDRRLALFPTLSKSLTTLWADHWCAIPDDFTDQEWAYLELPYHETVQAAFVRAVYSRRQLLEVLADFWHNHFSVYGPHEEIMPVFPSYDRDVIRAHALGNFRRFLEAVASHPAMLTYLDNQSNEVAGPNENYARELLELHTLGIAAYGGARPPEGAATWVDNDVYEVARCFTGWGKDEDRGRLLYDPARHDRFNKRVLGCWLRSDLPDMADGRAVLDILAEHPATAHHICFKLCRRLVCDDPPPGLVERAATVFLRANGADDQLRQVVGCILRSPEFRGTWGGKRKRPFEFAASLLRALKADFSRLNEDFLYVYESMGQPLFARPTPDGYPDRADAWRNTASAMFRWRLVQGLLDQELGVLIDLSGPQDSAGWCRRMLGRPARRMDLLEGARTRELVALLAMGTEFTLS
ncbi:MAG: DUF1800 domain-containing protein [Candidatus Eremiobacterota bacterium]